MPYFKTATPTLLKEHLNLPKNYVYSENVLQSNLMSVALGTQKDVESNK